MKDCTPGSTARSLALTLLTSTLGKVGHGVVSP